MTSPPSKRDKDRKGGVVAEEIEVTPEMIEAGLPLLYSFSRETCLAENTVKEIFLAMWAARKAKAERKARQAEKDAVESVWTESGKAE